MRSKWHLKDLLDLEYFLNLESDSETAHHRDRSIYLDQILPRLNQKTSQTSVIIRHWVQIMRRVNTQIHNLPGKIFAEVQTFLHYGMALAGLCMGGGIAFSILTYHGIRPINIAVYLGLIVGLQLFCLAMLPLALLIRRRIYLGSLISKIIIKISQKNGVLSGEKRMALESTVAMLRSRQRIYRGVFYWPFFSMMQIFGIGFNLGALGVTLIKILISDLAFGWQSTIQFSSQTVYEFVQIASLPWTYFLKQAHPSLSQIEGSHLVLKEGIYQLSSQALTSWWPFLCLCVVFYGLLPRIVLWGAGLLRQQQALQNLNFNRRDCLLLLRRMQTPLLSTSANTACHTAGLKLIEPEDSDQLVGFKQAIGLIPDEIADDCQKEPFRKILTANLGFNLQHELIIGTSSEEDCRLLEILREQTQSDGFKQNGTVFLLQEAWRPPIAETLSLIRTIVDLMEDGILSIVLIGKPEDTIFTPVKDADFRIWNHKMTALAEMHICTQRLVKDQL